MLRGAESTPHDDDSWPWSDARAVGRLRDGVTRDASRAELNAVFAALRAETPSIPDTHGVAVDPSGRLPPRARPQLTAFVALISALAAGLLVVACTNVAGMLLARATTRRHKVAMRLSLGASRGRLLRQMLLETLVLFALAALIALPLVWWLTGALSHLMPSNLPVPIRLDVALSYRTLLFGVGVALVAGLGFGLAPARHALATDLSQMLGGRSATDGPTRMRLRHALVVAWSARRETVGIATSANLQGRCSTCRLRRCRRPACTSTSCRRPVDPLLPISGRPSHGSSLAYLSCCSARSRTPPRSASCRSASRRGWLEVSAVSARFWPRSVYAASSLFLVAHRAREIAVRIALGASQAVVRRMVLGQAGRLGSVGALLGTGLALGLARGVPHVGLLIGVSAADPLTYAALLAAMGATLLVASYLPARRAAATDPAFVLRAQ